MKIVIGLMLSYLYTDFLFVYVYGSICGLKYSKKMTVFGTLLLWFSDYFLKIFPQYILGIQVSGVLNTVMLFTGIIYTVLLFEASVVKKMLLFFIYVIVQAGMDLLGMNIAGMLTGEYAFMDQSSNFTLVMLGCSSITITLGTVLFVWLWKVLERRNLKITKLQGLCLLLPMSQYAMIQGIALRYAKLGSAVPLIVGIGLIVGLLADIYMLLLLEKSNRKKQAENELQRLKRQYEVEQMRYEQLKETQEETAKIRHDFQNYVLALKQME